MQEIREIYYKKYLIKKSEKNYHKKALADNVKTQISQKSLYITKYTKITKICNDILFADIIIDIKSPKISNI